MENKNGEKIYTEGIKLKGRLYSWFDNYWYHYKWTTIVVAFFLAVFIVCTLQMCQKEEEDMSVIYAGPVFISANESEAICKVIQNILPEDYSEDGVKKVSLSSYHIYSKEQIEEIEAGGQMIDRSYVSDNNENFYDYVMTGETVICLLDPSIYESLKSSNRFSELSAALGYECEKSSDGYGIRISELSVYGEYSVMQCLPEDTVVCILRRGVVGRTSKQPEYEKDRQTFCAIVDFTKES